MVKALTIALAVLLTCGAVQAERIKDIADIKGVRGNPLWAYGLVVGLSGSGDNSAASKRALTNMLRRSGMVLEPDDLSSKNIASVIVTGELPAFGAAGTQIDVTISAIGNCSSLQGGTLMLTPLVGADGQVYAVAQGPISIGGFSAAGESASVSKNHPTVGRIPNGATVEKEEIATFIENGRMSLQLRMPDFTTAERTTEAINKVYPGAAQTVNAGTIRVDVPPKLGRKELAGFIDRVSNLDVKVDLPAIVVINEKTGTIVVGEKVSITSATIMHGNLSLVTQEKENVSQPQPFSNTGTTEKTHETKIKAVEDRAKLLTMPQVSVAELARALTAMGMTPRDLIAIFQALKDAGALQATLKIM